MYIRMPTLIVQHVHGTAVTNIDSLELSILSNLLINVCFTDRFSVYVRYIPLKYNNESCRILIISIHGQ